MCSSDLLDQLRLDFEKMAELPIAEKIQESIEEAQERYYQCKNKLSQAQELLATSKKEWASMEKNRLPTYPPDIYDIRDLLSKRNIENLLYAECIEITDPKWQLAIEAFIGRDRFTLFVSEKDFLEAKKIGEKQRYGYYISPYEERELPRHILPNSVLANLKILDHRISGRLFSLNEIVLVDSVEEGHRYKDKITITASGYRQDRRGGIFIARYVRFYCGGLAIERQIGRAHV